MKNTKRLPLLIILLAGLMFPTIQSCKKYPDGPAISFRSKSERVANNWKVENYKKNGTDYTSLVANYTEKYTKEGSYSYQWGAFSGMGTWAFKNSSKEIQITGTNNQASVVLYILKLEEDQFWYYYMDGSDKKEFHMITN